MRRRRLAGRSIYGTRPVSRFVPGIPRVIQSRSASGPVVPARLTPARAAGSDRRPPTLTRWTGGRLLRNWILIPPALTAATPSKRCCKPSRHAGRPRPASWGSSRSSRSSPPFPEPRLLSPPRARSRRSTASSARCRASGSATSAGPPSPGWTTARCPSPVRGYGPRTSVRSVRRCSTSVATMAAAGRSRG
jgi:hypothetical protein